MMVVKSNSRVWGRFKQVVAVACAVGLGIPLSSAVQAQATSVTAETLVDRASIEDLITRYYYNLGHGEAGSFSHFYTEDAEFVLGPNSYKGQQGIEGAYKSAGANSPARGVFAFTITISNPLIVVRGDTATARLIFTEFVIDKQGTAPRVIQQGREYDTLVKRAGVWRFSRRQIMAGAEPPAGWSD